VIANEKDATKRKKHHPKGDKKEQVK